MSKKYFSRILGASVAAFMAMTFASCSDVVHYDDDRTDIFAADGPPQIQAVYDVQDDQGAEALDGGTLNQMIRIHGKNLSHVKEITFNGLPVDVRQVYATSTDSYLKIPRQLPETVTNQLVYTTELGTVTYDFVVGIPSLEIEGLANEFAAAGESVEVAGEYFDLFGFGDPESDASVAIGSTKLEVDSITEDYMSIVIPEGTPDNTIITLSWTEPGNRKCTKNIPFRFNKYMLLPELNTVGWWDEASAAYVTDGTQAGDPEPTLGRYLRFKGHFDQWKWNSHGCGGNWPVDLDCRGHESEYVFKFEVCSAASYPFYDSQDWGYTFSVNDGNSTDGERVYWNPSAGTSFNTYGRWRTISIPLDVVASKGAPVPGEWSNFCLVMQPNTEGGWDIDHSFANFRVEPANF